MPERGNKMTTATMCSSSTRRRKRGMRRMRHVPLMASAATAVGLGAAVVAESSSSPSDVDAAIHGSAGVVGAGAGAGITPEEDVESKLKRASLRAKPAVPGRPKPSLDAARPYVGLASARVDGSPTFDETERMTRSYHMIDHDDPGIDLRLDGVLSSSSASRAGSGAMQFPAGGGVGAGVGVGVGVGGNNSNGGGPGGVRHLQGGDAKGDAEHLDEEKQVLCVTSLDAVLFDEDEDMTEWVPAPGILEGQFLAEYILCYGRAFDSTYFLYDQREEAKIEYMNVLDQKMGIFEEAVEDDDALSGRRSLAAGQRGLQEPSTGDTGATDTTTGNTGSTTTGERGSTDTGSTGGGGGGGGGGRGGGRRRGRGRIKRRTKVREKVKFRCGRFCNKVKDELATDSGRRALLAKHEPDHPTVRRLTSFEGELKKCLADNGYTDIVVTCGNSADDVWTETYVGGGADSSGPNSGAGSQGGGGKVKFTKSDSPRAVELERIIRENEWVVDPKTLDNPSSPQYRALKWIADEDKSEIDYLEEDDKGENRPQLLQRWVFATLYYATGGGEGHWIAMAYYMSKDHVCLWNQQVEEYGLGFPYKGNFCSGGMIGGRTGKVGWVDDITMPMNNLRGKIPPEIGHLTKIIYLNLSDNELEGSIPIEITKLTNCRHLALQTNRFTGPIPATIGSMNKLQELSLGWNSLDGTIPVGINNLDQCQIIFLSQNHLEGNLPFQPKIGGLQSLMTLELRDNHLEGRIPEGLSNYRNLFTLDLSRNQLNGPLPPDIGDIGSLGYLDVSENQLEGDLPASLGKATYLSWANLARNKFTGNIPDVSEMKGLQSLNLEKNLMSGQPPVEQLLNLPLLQYFTCHQNDFKGDLNGLCAKGLQLLVSDCFDGYDSEAELKCDCCNTCCSDSAGHCFYRKSN